MFTIIQTVTVRPEANIPSEILSRIEPEKTLQYPFRHSFVCAVSWETFKWSPSLPHVRYPETPISKFSYRALTDRFKEPLSGIFLS